MASKIELNNLYVDTLAQVYWLDNKKDKCVTVTVFLKSTSDYSDNYKWKFDLHSIQVSIKVR